MGCLFSLDIINSSASKKVPGSKDEHQKGQEQIGEIAANILKTQPPAIQEEMVEKAAEFLSKQPELRMHDCDPQQLKQAILEHLQKPVALVANSR